MTKIGTASKQNSEELQQRKMGNFSAQAYFQLDGPRILCYVGDSMIAMLRL